MALLIDGLSTTRVLTRLKIEVEDWKKLMSNPRETSPLFARQSRLLLVKRPS